MDLELTLDQEIEDELGRLAGMEVGTDQYKTTVDGLTKLIDRSIEMKKLSQDRDEKTKNREADDKFKSQQMEQDQKDRRIKNYIAIAGIAAPLVVTIWGTFKSFEFEREGTITSIMGRGFINKLIPKK